MGKKKTETMDEIISSYQKFHHKGGKSFKDRIKKFEEFHDSDNIHGTQLAHHAHYTVFGRPGHEKDFPGAYNSAYKVLDKHVAGDGDKLDDEKKLTEILETYVDSFLDKAMGKKFTETIKHAKKNGLKDKDLRELKGQLLGRYTTDSEGNFNNVLSESYIKKLKGKKKIALIEELKTVSEDMRDKYTMNLHGMALDGLISEEDRLDMAKYIGPKFSAKNWKHKDKDHIMHSAVKQAGHYSMLMKGMGEQLQKNGYKITKEEKENK